MGICQQRTVIITGAGGGLGRAYALAFAAEGANIIINGFGEADAIEAERAALTVLNGGKAVYDGADLTKPDEIYVQIPRR